MDGRASRRKGVRGEYGVRDYFRAKGFTAERVPSSGAARGFKGDVVLEKEGRKLTAEVKIRHAQFASIYALCPSGATLLAGDGVSCIVAYDFDDLGFFRSTAPGSTIISVSDKAKLRTLKKVFNLQKLVKTCDFLVIKSDYRPFIFIRFL